MDQSAPPETDRHATESDALAALPTGVFVTRWRQITGEPPAVLLNSRSAMIALLVESVPAAPLTLPGVGSERTDLDAGPRRPQKQSAGRPDGRGGG
jgi:hypothetical protein